MHQTNAAGFGGANNAVFKRPGGDLDADSTSKFPIMPERMDLTFMRCRPDFQRAIFSCHIIHHQKRCHQAVIAVRGKGKILMPFHRCCSPRQFRIDFRMM